LARWGFVVHLVHGEAIWLRHAPYGAWLRGRDISLVRFWLTLAETFGFPQTFLHM